MGRSKLSTQATSMKSIPRVTPYSASLRVLRLRDLEGGGVEGRLRFFDVLASGSEEPASASCSGAGSRCVDRTMR